MRGSRETLERLRIYLLLVLLVTGALAACGPSGGVQAPDAAAPSAPATEARAAAATVAPTAVLAPTLPPATLPPTAPSSPSPTPTLSPTSTPTLSPSPTLAPDPTASPSPTATETPTAAPSPSPGPEEATDPGQQVETGLEVYRAQYCGLCHTLTAAGTTGIFGPVHDGIGTLAGQRIADPAYSGAATTAAEYIRESIVEPQRYLVPGYEAASQPMPAYDYLSEAEIMALVEALLAQE